VAVLLAALTGALLGLLYGKPLESRKHAMGAVVVNSFLAAVTAAIAPHVPLFGWLKDAPMGAVALVLAFAARWAVPVLVEHAPSMMRAGLEK
ncbi:hypothetical protein, partial [Salmonella enterica]|uniref:hypothetical protein n=1 Tax=Salmonella enterica TaxID=28901 RepID=UPI0039E8393E